MLHRYFIRPATVDRIRALWIGDSIERYVVWHGEQRYAAGNVFLRVPVLVRFGEFARISGALQLNDLPAYVEHFVQDWLKHRKQGYSERARWIAARELRNPIHQLLRLIVPEYASDTGVRPVPFGQEAPGFFDFLRRDRGLRETTIVQYGHYLERLQDYLRRFDRPLLPELPPSVISAFIVDFGDVRNKRSVQSLCSILKAFFLYLYQSGLMTRDLSKVIESPRRYSLSSVPRSITWDEVGQVLQQVDRQSGAGRRDYAVLLLLVTYGLRAREVGALTLDDIDWKRDRLDIRGRKAGHSTAYPLAPAVGEAVLEYLKQGRPETTSRALFIGARAPEARGEIYRMIFELLYGLGLRVGEVSRLCLGDVDLDKQLLSIRRTKFGKRSPRAFRSKDGARDRGLFAEGRSAQWPDSPRFAAVLFLPEESKIHQNDYHQLDIPQAGNQTSADRV